MTEITVARPIETGLNSTDIIIDKKAGRVEKVIRKIPGIFDPDERMFKMAVGSSIQFLTDEKWRIRDMLPNQISFQVVENPHLPSGCEVHLYEEYVKGVSLSSLSKIPDTVTYQLAYFLQAVSEMAEYTKSSKDVIVIPDLLGGVERPHGEFRNFIVQEDSNKLFFIDVFPLAVLPLGLKGWMTRSRYAIRLKEAASRIGSSAVIRPTNVLRESIR